MADWRHYKGGMVDDLPPLKCRTSRWSGALTYPEPLGPPWPVAGHLYFTLLSQTTSLLLLPVRHWYETSAHLLYHYDPRQMSFLPDDSLWLSYSWAQPHYYEKISHYFYHQLCLEHFPPLLREKTKYQLIYEYVLISVSYRYKCCRLTHNTENKDCIRKVAWTGMKENEQNK